MRSTGKSGRDCSPRFGFNDGDRRRAGRSVDPTVMADLRPSLPQTGTLRRWNDERGFGFIAPADGGPDVFVHISAFPRDGMRPVIGEALVFELGRSDDGKARAVRIFRSTAASGVRRSPGSPRRREEGTNWVGVLTVLLVAAAIAAVGYDRFQRGEQRRALAEQPATPRTAIPVPGSAQIPSQESFQCDGRRHCSQMNSCAEATWFINHCPGMKMDGDNDGVPCEEQWCDSVFP